MSDTADSLLAAYGRGEIIFSELVAKFTNELPMTLPLEMREPAGNWAEVYQRAEEGDDTDVPRALSAASYAGHITEEQEQQLLEIYRQRVIEPAGDDPRLWSLARRLWPEGLELSNCPHCGASRADDDLFVVDSEGCHCDASPHHSVFCRSCSELFYAPTMGSNCHTEDGVG